MKGLAEFTKTTLIGGLLVVLPIYLSVLLLAKTLSDILALLSPVTAVVPAGGQFRQVIAIPDSNGRRLRGRDRSPHRPRDARQECARALSAREDPGLCIGARPAGTRLRRRERGRVPAGPGRGGGRTAASN
jgi:hypothetical protein